MTTKELFYLAGKSLALNEHPGFAREIVERLNASESDCQRFVQLCSEHLIIPAIYIQFHDHGILPQLEPELVDELAQIYHLNKQRNIQILCQIDEVVTELDRENIQAVFLKGTANLYDGLYTDIGERMIGDIDFLVKEEDYLKAGRILEAAGYCHDEKTTYTDYTHRKHYPALHKPGTIALVEIHRQVISERFSSGLSAAQLWKDQVKSRTISRRAVPCDRDKVIHTFLHSQLEDHSHAYRHQSLRDMYDLYLLSKRINLADVKVIPAYQKKYTDWLMLTHEILSIRSPHFSGDQERRFYTHSFNLALKFPSMGNLLVIVQKAAHLLFYRYMGGMLKMISCRDTRQAVYRRLTDAAWYRAHARHLPEYFS